MGFTILKNQRKHIQPINNKLEKMENAEIKTCFEHFKKRMEERCGYDITYNQYWNSWIDYIRGDIMSKMGDKKIVTCVGNYIKDTSIYKVIYTWITDLGIYVPLTIYEITDHKRKYRMYLSVLKYKKENIKI